MEQAIAYLASAYGAVHCEKGKSPPSVRDFLPHLKAWPTQQDGRYSDLDKEIFGQLL